MLIINESEISEYPLCVQEVCSHIFKLHKKYWRKYFIKDTNLTGVGQFLRSVRGDEFGSYHKYKLHWNIIHISMGVT